MFDVFADISDPYLKNSELKEKCLALKEESSEFEVGREGIGYFLLRLLFK